MIKFKSAAAAAISLMMIAANTAPADAHYWRGYGYGGYTPHYRRSDPGAAVAGAFLGFALGAIASQAYGGYAPPAYYYPNSSYDPYSFGPAGCAAGFYWNGQECWP